MCVYAEANLLLQRRTVSDKIVAIYLSLVKEFMEFSLSPLGLEGLIQAFQTHSVSLLPN